MRHANWTRMSKARAATALLTGRGRGPIPKLYYSSNRIYKYIKCILYQPRRSDKLYITYNLYRYVLFNSSAKNLTSQLPTVLDKPSAFGPTD